MSGRNRKKTQKAPRQEKAAVPAQEASAAADEAKKQRSTSAPKTAPNAQKKGAADTVRDSLNDIVRPIEISGLPKDEIELSVEEDRKRLLAEGIGLLVLVLVLLFAVFAFGVVANYTGNVWLLILIIFALTAVWFVSKRMGRFFSKYFHKTGCVDFGTKYVFLYLKGDPADAVAVTYRDIESFAFVRQGSSLRLLLWGDWVKHPSGYQYVGISRPFDKESLGPLEDEVRALMAKHHVKEKK